MKKQLKLILIMQNAHNNLGIIFKELGENQKAKECYEKAIKLILIMQMHIIILEIYLKN